MALVFTPRVTLKENKRDFTVLKRQVNMFTTKIWRSDQGGQCPEERGRQAPGEGAGSEGDVPGALTPEWSCDWCVGGTQRQEQGEPDVTAKEEEPDPIFLRAFLLASQTRRLFSPGSPSPLPPGWGDPSVLLVPTVMSSCVSMTVLKVDELLLTASYSARLQAP